MISASAKQARRFRLTAFVALCVAAAGFLAVWLLRPRGTGHQRVAEAQARAKRARQELLLTMRATNAAAKFVEKIGATNSPVAQTVMGAGSRMTAAAYRRDFMAQVGVDFAHRVEHLYAVATNTVARFDDFNQAQEAFATLTLAGLEDVWIRPQGRYYDLRTRLEGLPAAVAALRTNPVCRLETFADHPRAVEAMHALEAQAIRATIQMMKRPGQAETDKRMFSLFVRQDDADRARSLLNP